MPEHSLDGDPRREAVDVIRGFDYQIWQSVLAWLRLSHADVLFLEVAEDFDIHSGGGVSVYQVKSTSANITLRSPNVVNAIRNYWNTRNANPDRQIEYHFLSTSNPGLEQGSPFGEGNSGLEYWNTAKEDSAAARALVDFISTELDIPTNLLDFLRQGEVSDIQTQFLSPIYWELGAPDSADIRKQVEELLVEYGSGVGIPPSTSKKVGSHLFSNAFQIAQSHANRSLRRIDWLDLFERTTSVSVPASVIRSLLARTPERLVEVSPIQSTEKLELEEPSSYLQRPQLLEELEPRYELCNEIVALLESERVLVLFGSSWDRKIDGRESRFSEY